MGLTPLKRRRLPRSVDRRLALERLQVRMALDASISGYVFLDANGDGVRGSGEIGVPGVVLTLTGTDVSGAAVSRSTMSQRDGAYSFPDLPAGTYQVTQRQPRALFDGTTTTTVSGVQAANNRFSNLVLADGQHLTGNNFGEHNVRPEFVSIRWLFASAPPIEQLLREAVARAEELGGDLQLAEAIRAGSATDPEGTNRAPVGISDTYQVSSGEVLSVTASSGVLSNDTDPDGDALTAVLISGPANGSLTLSPNGALTYTPNAGFQGSDSFTYRANDGERTSNPVTVTITVTPPDLPDEAVPDFTLTDVNTHSATFNEGVSPRDYLEQVSGWYFGHST